MPNDHKRTWPEDERQYKTFLKPWEHRKLSSIRKADVQALHAKVGEKNGRYAANRLLALIRAMFNKAPDMGFTGSNPTTGIKKFPEEKRDRFLHGDELKKFFDALSQEPDPLFRDFFMVSLLTGARRANVQAMQWQDIDFQAGIWRIPDTKSGKPVVVPLVSPWSRSCKTALMRMAVLIGCFPVLWQNRPFNRAENSMEANHNAGRIIRCSPA